MCVFFFLLLFYDADIYEWCICCILLWIWMRVDGGIGVCVNVDPYVDGHGNVCVCDLRMSILMRIRMCIVMELWMWTLMCMFGWEC